MPKCFGVILTTYSCGGWCRSNIKSSLWDPGSRWTRRALGSHLSGVEQAGVVSDRSDEKFSVEKPPPHNRCSFPMLTPSSVTGFESWVLKGSVPFTVWACGRPYFKTVYTLPTWLFGPAVMGLWAVGGEWQIKARKSDVRRKHSSKIWVVTVSMLPRLWWCHLLTKRAEKLIRLYFWGLSRSSEREADKQLAVAFNWYVDSTGACVESLRRELLGEREYCKMSGV